MADPVVTITGGIPTTGTGTITTLGQVVAPQGASTSTGESGTSGPIRGPLIQGATVSSAPTYTAGTVNPLTTDTGGNLRVSGTVNPTTAANWGIGSSTQNSVTVANGQLVLGQYNLSPASITSTNMSPLQLDSVGNLRVTINSSNASVAVTQSGSWNVGQVGAPWSENITQFGGTNISTGTGAGGAGIPRVTISNDSTVNPQTIGSWGLSASTYNTATPTNAMSVEGQYNSTQAAMTSGNSSVLQTDKVGRMLAVGALRTLKGVQKTSITVATETTVVTAGAAGVFNDVYAILVTNKSATSVFVDFKDATAGTTRMTMAAPAGDTRGFTVAVDSAMVQAVAANNWTATVSSAVTSIEITVLYVSNL